ncbi:substrate-binding periplasmic protein [Psychromonas ossibalaenae]|uniref:substrate-binding periplasmic protein n=1 Tax=Psychromonas ossibalaenae TaxID=444922 RepID=UPI0003792B32|nr:transporter substrate-binding domain-containing protein [Psychromonas ossibalaenae]
MFRISSAKTLLSFMLFILLLSIPVQANLSICKHLVVTGNAEYPPILWRDQHNPGKLTGLAVELLELALMDSGITIDARDRGVWARAQQEAKHGEVDMLAGAFITDQRQEYMDYILPQFTNVPSVVWVKKGREFPFKEWSDLLTKRGGTLVNNSFGQDFDKYASERLDIRTSATAERSFAMLIAERFDYVLYELYQGLTILEVSGLKNNVTHLQEPVSIEGLYFTLSKKSGCNSKALRNYLNKRIQELTDFNTFDKLFDKHMQLWLEQQK